MPACRNGGDARALNGREARALDGGDARVPDGGEAGANDGADERQSLLPPDPQDSPPVSCSNASSYSSLP